jgi:hypothetical protein
MLPQRRSRAGAREKIAEPVESEPQRRPREGGDSTNVLFHRLKWIPAFAGMTLRSIPEARDFDFFTRSQAGTHGKSM